ncbi:ArsA family ATPase [Halosegnis marinus]|uniref:ArsA family ATPase n=1 Tax=Halosegnis marinus TaxID=3034023 RepID=A0ABD5ZPP0_9EURY|nr:TRC40/GET3/ArsA family transport-energizing ATPase [Halosegnis sp. DT85]
MARFVFFGGKGGVGKTSMSAAYAHKLATAGESVLLVSTDPAHSTADVFDQEFGDEPTPVEGYDSLSAVEIDPEREVTEHLMETKRALGDQVSAGIVNEIDRQLELAHQTPGAHESALFDRFIEIMREADHDRVVFDTSPTGGTLRLLSLPEYLGGWIDRLVEKREASIDLYERAAIGGREPRRSALGDPILARLRERKEKFEFARETLRDEAEFVLVANPDELSVRETERAVGSLAERDLPVAGVIVNRLTPAPDDDENGRGARFLRDRIATEEERLAELEALDPPLLAAIETRVSEVKGSFLAEVAAELDIETTI